MRRFEDIEAQFRTWLSVADDDMAPHLYSEMRMELENHAAYVRAVANAYMICGCCRRMYTEQEWNGLPPARGGLHKKDEYDLQEFRNCQTPMKEGGVCDATLTVVLESYGGMPLRGSRRVPSLKTDAKPSWCGGCDTPIKLGEAFVSYVARSAERQRPVPQNLCPRCDYTGTFGQSSSALPAPLTPTLRPEAQRHPMDCSCGPCDELRTTVGRLLRGAP